jgi:hypothetical protein
VIIPLLIFAQVSGVQLNSAATPHTVYVGQQVSYDGTMRVTDYAANAFQAEPDYTPPDIRGTTTYDFPFDPNSQRTYTRSGLTFQEYTYHRAFFPIAAGTYEIPPAALIVTMQDLHDPYIHKIDTLHSPPQTFVALPLPGAGRPQDFTGAVGRFTAKAHASTKVANAGEPFTLTLTVQGDGNLELLPRPALLVPWATIVKDPEQYAWDSTGTLVHGAKTFQWTITPHDGATGQLPTIRYTYFDPYAKRYAVATTEPITLTVGTATGTTTSSMADSMAAQDPAAATSPFPFLLRAARTHAVALGAALAMAALLIVITLRNRRPPDDEDLA